MEKLLDKLGCLNHLRYGVENAAAATRLARLEDYFASHFNAGCQLAVYGSLAPGHPNHHIIAGLQGEWESGLVVYGEFVAQGWGAGLGYPALRLTAEGIEAPVWLLRSPQLPQYWSRLDAFEGADYQRVLAPLYRAGNLAAVANLYELRTVSRFTGQPPDDGAGRL